MQNIVFEAIGFIPSSYIDILTTVTAGSLMNGRSIDSLRDAALDITRGGFILKGDQIASGMVKSANPNQISCSS